MVLASLGSVQAHAGIFVVNNGNDLDSNGVCDATSCTLRDAVEATRGSSADDVIEISIDYILRKIGTDDDNTAGDLDFCKAEPGRSVTVQGNGLIYVGWDLSTQWENRDRVFHVPDDSECYPVNLRIEGVGMGEGRVYDQDDGGGCVASHGDSLEIVESTLHDCRVSNSGAWGPSVPGGGAVQAHGALRMESVIAGQNQVFNTNGGAVEALGDLTLFDVRLLNNTVFALASLARGGAVYAPGGNVVEIEQAAIFENEATGQGGGLWLAPAHLRILDTEVFDNAVALGSGAGGGLYLVNPEEQGNLPIIERSLFADNNATATGARGGGIFFTGQASDPLRIHNTTFSANNGDYGGALALASQAMEVAVHHGTFHLNTAGNNDDVARVEGSAELSYLASLLNGRCNGSGTFSTLGYSVIRVFGGGPQCQVDLGVGDVGPSTGLELLGLDTFDGGLTRYHRLTGGTFFDAENVPSASCLAEDQRAAARPSSGTVCYAGSYEVP